MPGFGDEIVREFLEAYPEDFLRGWLRTLFSGYREAHQECSRGYAEAEAHDLYPHLRRAKLEGQLRGLARSHGIMATAESNRRNSSRYTLVRSGNVLLTASAVQDPNELIRRAAFRETFARESQLKLFGEQIPTGTALYAILLHGPDLLNRGIPEFSHVVFPDESCSQYVARINLFDMFSDSIGHGGAVEEEVVPDELDIHLRPVEEDFEYELDANEEVVEAEPDVQLRPDAEEQDDEEDAEGSTS